MAIIKKYNPKKIYLSDRLKGKFESILEYSLTVVEAPTGYGKTTAFSEYLKKSDKNYMWFNIDNNDKEQFFSDFCAKVEGINGDIASQMRAIGYPTDEHESSNLANAIMQLDFSEDTILVLDNYNYIADEYINSVIKDLSGKKDFNLVIVLITREITSGDDFDMITKRQVNIISKSDFMLDRKEIEEYFKLCGVKLEEKEIDLLIKYTEGWMNALYIQLQNYAENGSFEYCVGLNNLVYKNIWKKLTASEQEFLVGMSLFDYFSIRQALAMSNDVISEPEIYELLEKNGFIEYKPAERRYYIHYVFKFFLESEFEKLEPIYKKSLYKLAGQWCADNDDHYMAMRFYLKMGDYESILALDWSNSNIICKAVRENKNIFLEIVVKTDTALKQKYARNYLVFVLCLFILNERSYFRNECEQINKYIDSLENDGNAAQEELLGEMIFLNALNSFNNLEEMNNCYVRAFKHLNSPTKMFRGYNLILFGCPSVLNMFHTKEGNLTKELELIEKVMPNYYILTEGNSKGIESIMKAEALFEQGNLEDAYILCEKAKYMAESRNQEDVLILVELLKARISLMKAEFDNVNTYLNNMIAISKKSGNEQYQTLVDMCVGMINISYENVDGVPTWLKDSLLIESKSSIICLGYANIIYGRYLLINGDYNKLLAISGQMLDIAGIFSNVMYKIYTYIYIALAEYYTDKKEKAIAMLGQAIEFAYKDNIVMPFVAMAKEIENIITKVEGIEDDKEYDSFISNLRQAFKEYGKGLSVIKKASSNTQSYGLTKREYEVAKLAAQRLSNKEIGEILFIAESTVKSNLKIIFSKLSINSRNELKNFFK